MTALRRDPHLWIHLAGLASVPLWLDLCLAGLAVGDPVVPPWLEMGLLGLIGSGPLLWMQWQRPFYPFSLLLFAIRP
ncbi:MAG: low-complexity tail membrane protein, partial [Cyanobacteria bacterium P01_F01_bin.153]